MLRVMKREQRGLRFPFGGRAEVTVAKSNETFAARATELSLRGCFLEISSLPKECRELRVKIWHEEEFFEGPAEILYVRATGVGVVFGSEMKPHYRALLQKWILAALDAQAKLEPSKP